MRKRTDPGHAVGVTRRSTQRLLRLNHGTWADEGMHPAWWAAP